MILTEEMISIIFRLLNFGVLLVGLRYVYRHYICTFALSEIEADDKKVAILAQQKDAYYQQEQFLDQEIKNQQLTATRLMSKLAQWRAAAEDAERAKDNAHVVLEEALRKKVAEQSEHIAQYMLERRALPHAIHELEVSLANYFKDEKRGEKYISSIIDHIKKDR